MFTPAILKTWDPIHFQQCRWYLDCLVKKPPPFDIALKDSIQPMFSSPAASIPFSESSTPPKGGYSKSKTATKGSNPWGSKRKADDLVDDPMDEDIPITGNDIVVATTELADQIYSHPPRAPGLKHIHVGSADQAQPITFVPPAMKAMSSVIVFTSATASNRVLILNDSFNNMLDYKMKHNQFPSTYDEMVGFLTEVHILIQTHSIRLASAFSIIHYILNYLCNWNLGWSI